MIKTIKQIWTLYEESPEMVLDQHVSIRGRIDTCRFAKANSLLFIGICDGSTIKTIQCVCDREILMTNYAESVDRLWEHVSRGATLSLTGTIIKSPAKGQPIELVVTDFRLFGKIIDPMSYSLGNKGMITRDYLRSIPHIRHHTKLFTAIQCIKQQVYKSFHQAMSSQNIGEVQPTLITGNECEGGSFPFTVTTLKNSITNKIDWTQDFFGKKTYLTVSSQLHLEATVCGSMKDGYCMTTAFRAEPSRGPLHLAEFCMPEWELIDGGLERNMRVAEITLKHCFNTVINECKYELEFLEEYRLKEITRSLSYELGIHKEKLSKMNKKEWKLLEQEIKATFEKKKHEPPIIERLTRYVDKPFVISSHRECVNLMLDHVAKGKTKFEVIPQYNDDFTKEHEKYITEVIFEGMPVFVRYYPKHIKSFYMPKIEIHEDSDVEYVDCYDLLFPYVGEVVGGSQRIDDYNELYMAMRENMDDRSREELDWYLDLRKYGSVPHGGAGLGMGRLMIVITTIFNIKDMQEFPRGFGLTCYA